MFMTETGKVTNMEANQGNQANPSSQILNLGPSTQLLSQFHGHIHCVGLRRGHLGVLKKCLFLEKWYLISLGRPR